MHAITRAMSSVEKLISQKKSASAKKKLKKAEAENEKLVKIDRDVRDPKLEKCDKIMKKKK